MIEASLDALIGIGDLVEVRDVSRGGNGTTPVLVYTAPPSFVERRRGAFILLGVSGEQPSPLPDELEKRITYSRHVRRISEEVVNAQALESWGLIRLSTDRWLKAPLPESPRKLIKKYEDLLLASAAGESVVGFHVVAPHRDPTIYHDRWVSPEGLQGQFVGRRPQPYGADIWCYVDLSDGRPQHILDLPIRLESQGCDEAWLLQMAIDHMAGTPQRFRTRPDGAGKTIVDWFSPVPFWAQRRWDALGEPFPPSDCLFSYRFSNEDVKTEIKFARERLWLAEVNV